MPSAAELFASLLFGTIGFAAFMYGKKSTRVGPMILGVALMVFPYFISGLWLMYAAGFVLSAALLVWRE